MTLAPNRFWSWFVQPSDPPLLVLLGLIVLSAAIALVLANPPGRRS